MHFAYEVVRGFAYTWIDPWSIICSGILPGRKVAMKNDVQLRHDVLAQLERECHLGADAIGLEVHHGVVKLAGYARDYEISCKEWNSLRGTLKALRRSWSCWISTSSAHPLFVVPVVMLRVCRRLRSQRGEIKLAADTMDGR
jgi:hypothetical protein